MTRTARGSGRLIAIEGIDGSGKSTLVRALATALRRRGHSVALHREPNDRALGALAQSASVRDPWTGGVYFTVDRHLARPEMVRSLATHDLVLLDRSFYSTLAYQGSALRPSDRRRLERLQRTATIVPDRVVLLDLDPGEAIHRLASRVRPRGPLERTATLRRVAKAYRTLARRPGWVVVDARLPTEVTVRTILSRLNRLLSARGGGGVRPTARRRR
ncbi:MAG: dTMP kinase [Thermoplasmata archaeon]